MLIIEVESMEWDVDFDLSMWRDACDLMIL